LLRRWTGALDGNIDLTMQVNVQGESSKLVLEAAEDPGLFFIGGEHKATYQNTQKVSFGWPINLYM